MIFSSCENKSVGESFLEQSDVNRTFNDKLCGGAMYELHKTYHRQKDSDMYGHSQYLRK